jgi:acetyltransferase
VLPPLTAALAERLIEKTRVSRQLEAHRNLTAVDRGALVETLLRVSDMVSEMPEMIELDINPLLAGPEGVLAVDARIGVAPPASGSDRYGHIAIAPYPRHLEERDRLPDGRTLTIRPIRPEDAEREQAFVRGLSPEARHLRFSQAIKELPPALLAQFTQIDYAREIALVATVGTDGAEEQVGVARYVANPDGRSCEFAIVVGDRLRGQGIGTRLMQALIRAARAQGLATIMGVVLAGNAPMLQLMRRLGFSIRPSPEDSSLVEVELRL